MQTPHAACRAPGAVPGRPAQPTLRASSLVLALALVASCLVQSTRADPTRVAVIGDSMTIGLNLSPDKAFPSIMGNLLGPNFVVENFGRHATTIGHPSFKSYRTFDVYLEAVAFSPDIVVVVLGWFSFHSIPSRHLALTVHNMCGSYNPN